MNIFSFLLSACLPVCVTGKPVTHSNTHAVVFMCVQVYLPRTESTTGSHGSKTVVCVACTLGKGHKNCLFQSVTVTWIQTLFNILLKMWVGCSIQWIKIDLKMSPCSEELTPGQEEMAGLSCDLWTVLFPFVTTLEGGSCRLCFLFSLLLLHVQDHSSQQNSLWRIFFWMLRKGDIKRVLT